ncbi:phospholipid/cholesterol/gamma-HCH transport system substrate-binding protein [Sphingomonas laterariae]|uniref:Phospholipid/cholesterol/gamma-HCH transport system substrate-binding protein n=1 Tax=Edaphosphingomonas laterariae TaxID=861865 RepID=A0A239E125_9SPHN|nr:outer membrane lipid asymmetry maintenance protein MlaD [Sphingomonas laterariae]SNS37682.1 phospholipid/cholesterol/gamma-HCH transport system substrate-binding protein [Sphingomonas laterariae]
MKTLLRENVGEALVGLVVVALAAWFVLFAWNRTGGGARAGATRVVAMFPNAAGVDVGTDVRVAGLKVGTVAEQHLDSQTYQVAVTLAIDPAVKVPNDSSAAITSEGLLGGTFIALLPGGSETPLKTGDTIIDTQGATDLMGMIGQFVNGTGKSEDLPPNGEAAPGAAQP